MSRTCLKRLFTVLALCALSLGVNPRSQSSADGQQELINEQWVVAELIGNPAGAFAYYTIPYPGDRSVITIDLRYTPADPVTRTGVGFVVYGPYAFVIGRGESIGVGGEGRLLLKWSDDNPATWLVQVYNYIPDQIVTYRIVATGLPPPKPTPTPMPQAKPKAAALPPLIGSGYLTGRSAGAFAYHNVPVAGGPDVQLIMTYSPASPSTAKGIGFTVYGLQGEVLKGKTAGTSGERRATLSGRAPGAYKVDVQKGLYSLSVQFYRVQVYNLVAGLTISYTLRSGVAQ